MARRRVKYGPPRTVTAVDTGLPGTGPAAPQSKDGSHKGAYAAGVVCVDGAGTLVIDVFTNSAATSTTTWQIYAWNYIDQNWYQSTSISVGVGAQQMRASVTDWTSDFAYAYCSAFPTGSSPVVRATIGWSVEDK